MLTGKLYDPSDTELVRQRQTAHSLCRQYNNLDETDDERESILDKLFVKREPGVYLQGPIFFDYGVITQIGENTYANFNFTVLDCAPVSIGKNVFFGPNVAICAGVTIGEGSVIGAGSVVTRDIPAGAVAVGNPCRVLKKVE